MRKSYIYDVETICNTKNEVADAMSKHITLIAYTCEDNMELKKAIGDKAGRKSENFWKNAAGVVAGIGTTGAMIASGGTLIIPVIAGALVGSATKGIVGSFIGDQLDNYSVVTVPGTKTNGEIDEMYLIFIRNNLNYNSKYDYITYGESKFIVLDNNRCPYCHKKLPKGVWYGNIDCTEGEYAIKLSDKMLKETLSEKSDK